MDIEKLIERLRTDSLYADKATLEIMDLCMEAADAISTLQAENEKLLAELDDLRIQWDMYGGDVGITAVYEELEQVKQERDAAVGDMEALMWYSGEGCQICANAVEVFLFLFLHPQRIRTSVQDSNNSRLMFFIIL